MPGEDAKNNGNSIVGIPANICATKLPNTRQTVLCPDIEYSHSEIAWHFSGIQAETLIRGAAGK